MDRGNDARNIAGRCKLHYSKCNTEFAVVVLTDHAKEIHFDQSQPVQHFHQTNMCTDADAGLETLSGSSKISEHCQTVKKPHPNDAYLN